MINFRLGYFLSISIDLIASLTAFNAYFIDINEWSAICAVATVCPNECATGISSSSFDSFANQLCLMMFVLIHIP
ncbi:MAG TPA: hypothetical protein PLD02_07855 [Saprospiraceae bacterium]|nr:hypothetical protein [Saprospiraceae bacterium]